MGMTDLRARLADALREHARRTDPNHPCWPKCRCGFDPEAYDFDNGGWPGHVAGVLLSKFDIRERITVDTSKDFELPWA
jgi:hypothetical protein